MPGTTTSIAAKFEAIVKAHTAELLRYALSRVADKTTAEDLVQLTFLAAWQAKDGFEERSSVRTWLFSILKNKLADHYRKSYRDPVVHGPDPLIEAFNEHGNLPKGMGPQPWPGDAADDPETMSRYLTHCLDHLAPNLRAAIEMKYLKEKNAAEICQELGITATNYWQQLHRAKMKLRECITKQLAKH
jgi:RNA polymerase sigma factor (sigma-70 family)